MENEPFSIVESHVETIDDLPSGELIWLDLDDGLNRDELAPQPSEIDALAQHCRDQVINNLPVVSRGVLSTRKARSIAKRLAQADPGYLGAPVLAPTRPASREVILEDLQGVWQYVPPPDGIDFGVFEKEMFTGGHILGEIHSRVASAMTRLGTEIKPYQVEDNSIASDALEPQINALEAWRDQFFKHGWKRSMQTSNAMYHATGNLYWEIVRDGFGPDGKPCSADWLITSQLRVMHGHRGFVQAIGQKFTWYNNYIPTAEARRAGIALWEQYWADRGVDAYSQQFKLSFWATTLSSSMPEGVWNPNLTEVMHFADIALASKYYGFPRDFRLQKLHVLVNSSLDWNIAIQREGSPPYVLVFHGNLTDQAKNDLKEYIRQYRGSRGAGQVPVINAVPPPPGFGTGPGSAPRSGLERVTIGSEYSEGQFNDVVKLCLEHMAMSARYPLDMLMPTNSNRATALVSEGWLYELVVEDDHQMFEEALMLLTKDAGFGTHQIRFKSLDLRDKLEEAQIAWGYQDRGDLSPNEVRTELLGKPSRPGGDQYTRMANSLIEDEAGEDAATGSARKLATTKGSVREPLPLQKASSGDV